jgi:hypothetical protein
LVAGFFAGARFGAAFLAVPLVAGFFAAFLAGAFFADEVGRVFLAGVFFPGGFFAAFLPIACPPSVSRSLAQGCGAKR